MFSVLLALIAGCLYWGDQPVWDDNVLIVQYLWTTPVSELWSESMIGGVNAAGYFRPLSMSLLALLPSIWLIHVVTTILHAGSTALLFHFLGKDERAYFCSSLFAVHPICSEVLGWASCLPDAMAVHLGLWALILHPTTMVGASIALFLGLCCKEIAFLPLLIGLLVSSNRSRAAWLSWMLPIGLFVLLRSYAGVSSAVDISGKEILIPKVVGHGVWALLWPFPVMPVRDILSLSWVGATIGLVLLIGMIVRRPKGWWMLIVAPMLLSLPPVLSGYFAAERYLYLSLLGGCLWLGKELPTSLPRWAWLCCIPLLAVHGSRALIWKSDLALFSTAVEALPNSAYTWHLLGMSQLQSGAYRDCASSFERSLGNARPHVQAPFFRLVCLVEAEQFQEAFEHAERGETSGLSKEYVQYWIRAAEGAGQAGRAADLQTILE